MDKIGNKQTPPVQNDAELFADQTSTMDSTQTPEPSSIKVANSQGEKADLLKNSTLNTKTEQDVIQPSTDPILIKATATPQAVSEFFGIWNKISGTSVWDSLDIKENNFFLSRAGGRSYSNGQIEITQNNWRFNTGSVEFDEKYEVTEKSKDQISLKGVDGIVVLKKQ